MGFLVLVPESVIPAQIAKYRQRSNGRPGSGRIAKNLGGLVRGGGASLWDGSMNTKRTVRNCPVEFRFQCPKLWDDLAVTSDPAIRHCEECDNEVFFCTTDLETIAHARAGRCIARELPDPSELPRIVLGPPSRPPESTLEQREAWQWNARERAIDDAIRNAGRSARSCPRCSYPASVWGKTCRVCGYEMGRALREPDV
jgi:hypothetical protein